MLNSTVSITKNKNYKFVAVLILYLLGIFMGAIDTGIVSPARTIIQHSLGVNEKTGIWMVTIYTLTYASIIPISGKLADKFGRKYIYLASIFLFSCGSLICGLSSFTGKFEILLIGRVIQAIGGGGIMPIATAEFGTTFPPEKRGMALGLVGATYGVANILGSSIGSAILDIFGTQNWKWLFFINIPISIVILIGGIIFIKNTKSNKVKKIDKLGTLILICMISSLLYGLMNIDFFNFYKSIQSISVYPYLLIFLALIPFFIVVEKKAIDPILNFDYFTKPKILLVLVLSLVVGLGMMGMVFVPQYAENALKIKTGSGGYFVAILGVFAGFGAPLSGRLIDRYGPKKILLIGYSVSMLGALYLVFIATETNTLLSVCISLILMGIGMGFTMGTPLNYMMLSNTDPRESNSALATLSLIRSIGTAISPAIMVGFLAHAGLSVQSNVMNVVGQPKSPEIIELTDLQTMINDLKKDPEMANQLKNINIPSLDVTSNIDMTSGNLSKNLTDKLQSADVSNITDITKEVSSSIYKDKIPPVILKIQSNIQNGIDGTQKGIDGMNKGISELEKGIQGIQVGINNMSKALSGINRGISGVEKGYDGLTQGINGMKQGLAKQDVAIKQLEDTYNNLPDVPSINKDELKNQITTLKNSRIELNSKLQSNLAKQRELYNQLTSLKSKKSNLQNQLNISINQKNQMLNSLNKLKKQKDSLVAVLNKTQEVNVAIPKAFEKSQNDYILSIENNRKNIESIFQNTLNIGFKQMYITVFTINLIAFGLLLFYKEN